nr:hypothetical protein Itr_chr10CG12470 [Ipomoea trifida]
MKAIQYRYKYTQSQGDRREKNGREEGMRRESRLTLEEKFLGSFIGIHGAFFKHRIYLLLDVISGDLLAAAPPPTPHELLCVPHAQLSNAAKIL